MLLHISQSVNLVSDQILNFFSRQKSITAPELRKCYSAPFRKPQQACGSLCSAGSYQYGMRNRALHPTPDFSLLAPSQSPDALGSPHLHASVWTRTGAWKTLLTLSTWTSAVLWANLPSGKSSSPSSPGDMRWPSRGLLLGFPSHSFIHPFISSLSTYVLTHHKVVGLLEVFEGRGPSSIFSILHRNWYTFAR